MTSGDARDPGTAGVPDPPAFPALGVEASHRIYDSPWVGLRRDILRLEDGRDQEHHFVEIGPAVAVVPIRADGRLVLVGQYRHAHGGTFWEVPAGRLDAGEDPAVGAARELREETGHTASELVPLPGFYPINGISDHWAHAFVATGCTRVGALDLDDSERLEVHVFPPEAVREKLVAGEIADGFTALALYAWLARGG